MMERSRSLLPPSTVRCEASRCQRASGVPETSPAAPWSWAASRIASWARPASSPQLPERHAAQEQVGAPGEPQPGIARALSEAFHEQTRLQGAQPLASLLTRQQHSQQPRLPQPREKTAIPPLLRVSLRDARGQPLLATPAALFQQRFLALRHEPHAGALYWLTFSSASRGRLRLHHQHELRGGAVRGSGPHPRVAARQVARVQGWPEMMGRAPTPEDFVVPMARPTHRGPRGEFGLVTRGGPGWRRRSASRGCST